MAHKLKALYIAKEIPISRIKGVLEFKEILATKETAAYRFNGSVVYVYSFGSIVFVDTSDSDEKDFLKKLSSRVHLKRKRQTEEYSLIEDPKVKALSVNSACVVVKQASPGVMKVVARILAQSVALESYEEEFEVIDRGFSALNHDLAADGKLNLSSREVMRMMARNNIVMEEMVSGIGILDKPDAAWESAFMDTLHTKLSDEFEIQERFENLNSKIDFVQENYKVFLESLRSRYDIRLEWIIIILIVIEIMLFVYELFCR